MYQAYNLEWLDTLITVSLNPAKTDFSTIHQVQPLQVKSKIENEKNRVKRVLKDMAFSLGDEGKVKLLIKQYHSSLTILLDQAMENYIKCPGKIVALKELTHDLVTCIEELIAFIERRFLDYLSPDEHISMAYFLVAIKDLNEKLDKLKVDLKRKKPDNGIIDVILQVLYSFMEYPGNEHACVFKEISYIKELCYELEHLPEFKNEKGVYTSLDQLLVYMNFNSKLYVDNFIHRITEKENGCENIAEKVKMLLFNLKEFNQMHRKPGVILNPRYMDLKDVLDNWFRQEILYLKRKSKLPIYSDDNSNGGIKQSGGGTKDKVLCRLSTDQLGVILRAADELNILVAKSMSVVFKGIVPFLSTPYRKNLSYDAVRSKSYAAETKDKEIAIETLKTMIDKIREY